MTDPRPPDRPPPARQPRPPSERALEVLLRAPEKDPEERPEFVATTRQGDEALEREVSDLLRAEDELRRTVEAELAARSGPP